MRCAVCFYLKREARIRNIQNADIVVDGSSLCKNHVYEWSLGHSLLVNVEHARENLRVWWKAKERQHGPWDEVKNRFDDVTTLEAAGGY
jgi:hypothetical protein